MPIVAFDSTRASDTRPGPARYSNITGQLAIAEKQAQRCPLHLQRVGTFTAGELLLEVSSRQFVGARIQLRQADDMMCCPRPFHKSDGMFLVSAARLKRMNLAGRNRPGSTLLFAKSKLGITS